jgi:DNA-binding LacI/PurR family transcriptional regulator
MLDNIMTKKIIKDNEAKTLQRTRLKDIANLAGVSHTTVAHVLLKSAGKNARVSIETANRVRTIAEELGYKPDPIARQLRGKSSKTIAVLIGSGASPINHQRLEEIERLINVKGYHLVIGHPNIEPHQIAEYVDDFIGRGVDGIISYITKHTALPEIIRHQKNVVYVYKPPFAESSYVDIDEAYGTHQLVDHIISRGYKKIGLALPDTAAYGQRERIRGYKEALIDNNIKAEQHLIWTPQYPVSPDPHFLNPEIADKAIDDLIIKSRVDAIIAATDYWAAQIIKSLKSRGFRVPNDVAVASYDNLDIARLIEPELTTLDPQNNVIAESIVNMLLNIIEHPNEDRQKQVTIKPKLIVRNST